MAQDYLSLSEQHSFRTLPPLLIITLLFASTPFRELYGQRIEARFQVDASSDSVLEVHARFSRGRHLSFLRSIMGIDELAMRISDLRLVDGKSSRDVVYRQLVPGEYVADSDFDWAFYRLNPTPLKNRSSAAHVSWLNGDVGILMLGDLLPKVAGRSPDTSGIVTWSARAGRRLPVYSVEKQIDEQSFEFDNVDDAVFFVGNGWRSRELTGGAAKLTFNISGQWNFTDDEAASMLSEIFSEHQKLFAVVPGAGAQVGLAKFPTPAEYGAWEAETRGRNVTIISSDMPFKTQSLQRLHEQLRHEVFHLWIPNGVNLTGNYDWFYEGFALYRSLKLAVSLNRIRFEDFLDTLSRAHTIDSAHTRRPSLIEASKTRFLGSNTQIYARGMLVAFLCDLELLRGSKGKRSVEYILRELFEKHRKPAEPVEGNAAVLSLLRSNPQIVPIVESYITGADRIEWTANLAAAGIEDADTGPLTALKVKEKLNRGQKTLLDKLGYNNWRKLSPNSK
ncbi:MAG TPA: hypothetical protein VFZ23_10870 [Pyrinomonadaceae bacterium]